MHDRPASEAGDSGEGREVPTCPFSLADAPVGDDRAVGWNMVRDAGEVVEIDGAVFLTSWAAVEEGARHPDVFSSKRAFDSLGSPLPLVPLAIDPPDHVRYRRLLDPFFAPRRLATLEANLRAQVGELLDGLVDRPSFDAVAELAVPYPSQVFLTLFGFPLSDREQLLAWKDGLLKAVDPTGGELAPDAMEAALGLFEYVQRSVTERRRGDGDDLMTQLLQVTDEGGLTDEDVIGLSFLFVLAGLDTVTAAIGFALYHLAVDGDVRRAVASDLKLVPAFVEEVLRLELPAPMPPRVATRDHLVGDVVIREGSRVHLTLATANRDPAVHDHPDQLDITRQANRHFAFGAGVHRCLGSHLARMELRLVLEEFLLRVPDFELAPGVSGAIPWPRGTLGFDELPLVVPGAEV
ncbi:MAG TPA: cytochrome P450 [Acidimicrobiia bacterium]|jgi:cytochrome P450